MSRTGFTHLHVHSAYSLLDGMITVDKLVEKARRCGMTSLALTDHGNMFGAIEFYLAAKDKGIKPIIGCEIYVAPGDRKIKERRSEREDLYYHLVLLCKNIDGYRNLIEIVTDAWLTGHYYRPRTDLSVLRKHSEGLIALSACLGGEVSTLLKRGDLLGAEGKALEYQQIFHGDFYLELQKNGLAEQEKVNEGMVEINRKLGIPLVATNDVHFLDREDFEAHTILMALQSQKKISEIRQDKTWKLPEEVYFRTPEEMTALFADHPEAIENTKRIADQCNCEIETGKFHFPKFPVPEGYTEESFFEELVRKGLKERYPDLPEAAVKRAEMEMEVVRKMNFAGYFLIVWDFIRFARETGVPVGPGRGSSAGSIVAYSLRITNVDPLVYGLLFERFLNPERKEMPDIDIDFGDDRREEVVQYIRKKYGEKNVAQIVTFGTLGAKSSIRDVARVLEIPLGEADRIAKLVPEALGTTLESAFKSVPELRQLEASNPAYARLFKVARKLENLVRNMSKHAAGLIIADDNISKYIPLCRDKDGNEVSQYDKGPVEKVGLIKMDLLGLRTLTIIRDALAEIKRTEGLDIDADSLPLDDKKTFHLLQKGRTVGVFQMEAGGFTKTLVNLHPTTMEDVVALLALYRPGPLQSGMVETFIHRKHGKEPVDFIDPKFRQILKDTFGVIVYQEQVMLIAQAMSGYTLAEADHLRKAMGKKDEKIMAKQLEKLVDGAVKHGFDKAKAGRVVDLIKQFAKYGFNKSHSVVYAHVAWQTAWLKAHYPVEFMAGLMTNEMANQERFLKPLNETRAMKIPVMRPDVNMSRENFRALKDPASGHKTIVFCLTAIKGVGDKAVCQIVDERDARGPYKDFLDFCLRTNSQLINKKVVENLIRAGAFDSLDPNRKKLFENLEKLQAYAARVRERNESGQIALFDETPSFKFEEFVDWDDNQKLEHEKEYLGFYLTSHPLARYREILEHFHVDKTSDLAEIAAGSRVKLVGLVTALKEELVKEKYPKITFTLEDFEGFAKIEIFGEQAVTRFRPFVADKGLVYIDGTAATFGTESTVTPSRILPIDNFREESISEIHIKVNLVGLEEETFEHLKKELQENKGTATVYLHFVEPMAGQPEAERRVLRIFDSLKCHPTKRLKHFLVDRFGEDSYWFDYKSWN